MCSDDTAGNVVAAGEKRKWLFGREKLKNIFSCEQQKYLVVQFPLTKDALCKAVL